MASETVDPINWSHPPPSWAVPPERLVHSINQCIRSENRTCIRSLAPPCLCGHSGYKTRTWREVNGLFRPIYQFFSTVFPLQPISLAICVIWVPAACIPTICPVNTTFERSARRLEHPASLKKKSISRANRINGLKFNKKWTRMNYVNKCCGEDKVEAELFSLVTDPLCEALVKWFSEHLPRGVTHWGYCPCKKWRVTASHYNLWRHCPKLVVVDSNRELPTGLFQ